MSDFDESGHGPYCMIGTQTTIHGKCRNTSKRPIGFIWPEQSKIKEGRTAVARKTLSSRPRTKARRRS